MFKRKSTYRLKRGASRPWSWLPGGIAVLIFFGLAVFGVLQPLERMIYAATLHGFAPETKSKEVVVVTLNEKLQASSLVTLFERLDSAGVVAFLPQLTMPLDEKVLDTINQRIAALSESPSENAVELQGTLVALRDELDTNSRLAAQLSESGNAVLAVRYPDGLPEQPTMQTEFGTVAVGATTLLDALSLAGMPRIKPPEPPVWPVEQFHRAASASGFIGEPGVRNRYPALSAIKGSASPGMLLQILRMRADGVGDAEVRFEPGGNIAIGDTLYATDSLYRFYPYADLSSAEAGAITSYSLGQVVSGKFPAGGIRGKTVIVGDAQEAFPLARAVEAMLAGQHVAVPEWALWTQAAVLLFVTLLVLFFLPRLGLVTMTMGTAVLLLLMLNSEFFLLLLSRQWLPLSLPALLLILAYPLLIVGGYLGRREAKLRRDLSESNFQLGRLLQSHGDFEQAFDKYRCCQFDERLLEQLYHLGLDFERKRQFAKAIATFEYIGNTFPTYKDIGERIERNRSMEQRMALGNGATAPGGTVIMEAEGVQNPILGHYEVERELGRGAMGMVYLARDPRIGRPVAVKTMALSSEFEGTQLKEVKARFFREAETAGRLNHPNIVHVYDVGEEQDLAYIAMDYLQGENLGSFVKRSSRLPLKEVLGIAIQVAEALDYAHRQGVVHRDIKPANIIYDKDNKTAKVTDFGVASLTDSSKTKTGTVLGSPSYMSPEQVAGKRVDGRADLFSLGVTLYQLVTSHLPFEADSLGSLMYKIANEAHPKPGKYRKGVPVCVTRIINKCMQKDAAKRYQTGADLAAALKRCRK